MKHFIFLLSSGIFLSQSFAATSKEKVYLFEPTVTTLRGTLQTKDFPGPPNYEDVRKGDKVEGAWLLKLPKPITVFYDYKDGDPTSINETETSVKVVQLVTSEKKVFKILRESLGREIECNGTLFHRHTGHHHTKILMYIKSCKSFENSRG